jgi:CDP-diacylglycerol--glycerol-3-phosphate 3-phosphatidyltransferase
MNWKLPNQLTLARLVLAIIFSVLLSLWPHAPGVLNLCFGVYIVAGITDILDGYLARRWKITSAFGRITDPFVDKVLVCGAFVLLAGNHYAFGPNAGAYEQGLARWITGGMASGVQAWMVVVVIAREFIISGFRGYSESLGRKFPATSWGKLKMFSQSVAICASLLQMANYPQAAWAVNIKLITVWVAVALTLISGLAYVNQGRNLFKTDEVDSPEGGA